MRRALRWVRGGLLLLAADDGSAAAAELFSYSPPLPPAGEPSHALPDACLQCMSHASAHQRLADLQLAAVDAAAAAAFEEHMMGCV